MQDNPYLMYTLADPFQFETLDKRAPSREYLDVAEQIVPSTWLLKHQGVWTEALPPMDTSSSPSGWKIHLSVIPKDAIAMLLATFPILVDMGLPFKFCTDRRMHELTHNKNWPRTQIGKFITVYPRNENLFRSALERLYAVTREFNGPYILSDRNYRSSRCLFYRYGAYGFDYRLEHNGHRIGGFPLENGEWVDDIRAPGAYNPLELPIDFDDDIQEPPAPDSVLLHGRYRIASVIKFTGEGGTYFGHDELLDKPVVVREHRDGLGGLAGVDDLPPGFAMVTEARVLAKLADTGITPKLVDCFEEDSHWFLVQERLEGYETLWGAAMNFYFTRDKQTASDTFSVILKIVLSIAEAIKSIHSHHVVIRDLTKTNVLASPDGNIRFIDFEFAHDIGSGRAWVNGWTSGYASKDQRADAKPCFEDDYYAFGVLILDLLTFSASGYDLNREGILARLRMNLADLGFPRGVEKIVRGLTDQDKGKRWTIQDAIDAFLRMEIGDWHQTPFPTLLRSSPEAGELRYREVLDGLCEYLEASASPERPDRLWPASPEVWTTNPVSIKFGAAGTAYFLLNARGRVDDTTLDWIVSRTGSRNCPPGLYSGLAGVACFLLDAGRGEQASAVMDIALRECKSASIPHGFTTGLAGIGTAALTFYRETGISTYLDEALGLAERLVGASVPTSDGISWSYEGITSLGFAYGASGVALFLLQCGLASTERVYLDAAQAALDYDLSFRVDRADRRRPPTFE
ncbi:MAG TPA: lanthionine synthetase LanC family protein [Frateuria sp.]|uniref:class III lanthionine synthetase LanKC N-terminal domain-containing protein n=1 Tax=Frateuria sp. TaxID=2211372 RepID=UPI002DF52047|nr:lanthionine synthetase LanC family protein [Frateuria sp.]